MSPCFEAADYLLFGPISELVPDCYLALSFGNEENLVVLWGDLIILDAKAELGSVENGVKSLDNIVDDVLVVRLVGASLVRPRPKQKARDRILLYGLLEDLDRAENAVSLRNPLLHEVVQLVLQPFRGLVIGVDQALFLLQVQFVLLLLLALAVVDQEFALWTSWALHQAEDGAVRFGQRAFLSNVG